MVIRFSVSLRDWLFTHRRHVQLLAILRTSSTGTTTSPFPASILHNSDSTNTLTTVYHSFPSSTSTSHRPPTGITSHQQLFTTTRNRLPITCHHNRHGSCRAAGHTEPHSQSTPPPQLTTSPPPSNLHRHLHSPPRGQLNLRQTTLHQPHLHHQAHRTSNRNDLVDPHQSIAPTISTTRGLRRTHNAHHPVAATDIDTPPFPVRQHP